MCRRKVILIARLATRRKTYRTGDFISHFMILKEGLGACFKHIPRNKGVGIYRSVRSTYLSCSERIVGRGEVVLGGQDSVFSARQLITSFISAHRKPFTNMKRSKTVGNSIFHICRNFI